MKQHEYEMITEKDVYENETFSPSYRIEVITNNYECYKDLKDGIRDLLDIYEDKEGEEQTNGNQD